MDLALIGKRALVTGSTGGIGDGIAKMIAREGAVVVVQGRNESAGRRVQEIVPNSVGQVGRVDDIASAVAFLVSPLAGFINGANLRIDGGSAQSVN